MLASTPRDSKGHLEESRAEELATFLQESLEAGQLAQQEAHSVLELVRAPGARSASPGGPLPPQAATLGPPPRPPQLQEKSQALEVSLAKLGKQVKDLSDHLVALSWRLDLQEQTLSVRLCEVRAGTPAARPTVAPSTHRLPWWPASPRHGLLLLSCHGVVDIVWSTLAKPGARWLLASSGLNSHPVTRTSALTPQRKPRAASGLSPPRGSWPPRPAASLWGFACSGRFLQRRAHSV